MRRTSPPVMRFSKAFENFKSGPTNFGSGTDLGQLTYNLSQFLDKSELW